MQIIKKYLPFYTLPVQFTGIDHNSNILLKEITQLKSGQFVVTEYSIGYDITNDTSPRTKHELLIPIDPAIYGEGFVLDVDSKGPKHVIAWLRASVDSIVRAHIALSQVGSSSF